MIVSSKKFMTQLVESIGRMTAMCFEDGVKADKEVTRDLGMMRDALWKIRDTLWLIKGILADAAKEPEPVKEDKPLGDIFEDMNKTMKESTLFDTLPKRRSRESVRWEAAERNLISLDGLRMRYKVSKATIDAAVAYLGLKLQEIEGSQAKYIDRAKISEISDYLNKA